MHPIVVYVEERVAKITAEHVCQAALKGYSDFDSAWWLAANRMSTGVLVISDAVDLSGDVHVGWDILRVPANVAFTFPVRLPRAVRRDPRRMYDDFIVVVKPPQVTTLHKPRWKVFTNLSRDVVARNVSVPSLDDCDVHRLTPLSADKLDSYELSLAQKQRISFAFGNVAIENPDVTKDMVRALVDAAIGKGIEKQVYAVRCENVVSPRHERMQYAEFERSSHYVGRYDANALPFGIAVHMAVQRGCDVRRKSWPSGHKLRYIAADSRLILGNGDVMRGWLPEITDIVAEDWSVIDPLRCDRRDDAA